MKAAALLVLLLWASPVAAETLVVSLSTHRVSINSTYAGTQLAVFGSVERDARTVARGSPYDVVITVRGPQGTVIVREKDRVGPIWLNREQRRYPNVPFFLSCLSSRPLGQIVSQELARRLNICFAPLMAQPPAGPSLDPRDAEFRTALIRLKQDEKLYFEDGKGVTFLTEGIFQAPVIVPAAAPTGNYSVEVALFTDGSVLARHNTNFEVVKAGFEQFIAEAARQAPWSYGFAAAGLAVLFGWLASVAFRRD